MKIKMRKPSVSKSLKARTTGRITRAVKSSYNPTYGKKGMGYINDPKRAVKNAIYNRTTTSAFPSASGSSGSGQSSDYVPSRPSQLSCGSIFFLVVIGLNIVLWGGIWIYQSLSGANATKPIPPTSALEITADQLADVRFDSLQELFLKLGKDLTYEETLGLAAESGLKYAEHNNNSENYLIVGYTDEATKLTHAKGDKITITYPFVRDDDAQKILSFAQIVYTSSGIMAIEQYRINGHRGDHWGFQDEGIFLATTEAGDYIYERFYSKEAALRQAIAEGVRDGTVTAELTKSYWEKYYSDIDTTIELEMHLESRFFDTDVNFHETDESGQYRMTALIKSYGEMNVDAHKNKAANVLNAIKETGFGDQLASARIGFYYPLSGESVIFGDVAFAEYDHFDVVDIVTPAPVATYEELAKGSKSDAVRDLQQRLVDLNYLSGKADGGYGNMTAQAVTDFQATAGITPSGIADNATQAALFAEDAPKNPN